MTEMLISDSGDAVMDIDEEDVMQDVEDTRPASFPRLHAGLMEDGKPASRRIPVPEHRYTPLRNDWTKICTPIVQHLKLQIRMNLRKRSVDLRTSEYTEDVSALQKAADFVKAYMLGFAVEDAVALLRLEDLFIESFEVDDVKMLHGEHMSRAIGRVAGQDGKTKFAIENATRTRIVLADKRVHILGTFTNIKIARDAICALIMGSPPGKVYARLRQVVFPGNTVCTPGSSRSPQLLDRSLGKRQECKHNSDQKHI